MLRKTAASLKQYYHYVLSAALIIVLILIVYGGDLGILANEAMQNDSLSHILLMPFFTAILLYLKKDMVKASLALENYRNKTRKKYMDELVGAALCIIAFLIYWYGSHTFYPLEHHILSLPIFTLGVTLILFNLKAMLVLALPLLFLLFLVPTPAEFVYGIGGAMGNFNTQASYALLKTFGLPVELSTSYGPPSLALTSSLSGPVSFVVDVPCSGIYSLIAFTMFAAFLALATSGSVPRKTGTVLFGLVIFEVLSVVRITAIVSIAYQFGQEIAMNLFHAWAGLLLTLIGMVLTLLFAEKVLKMQIIPTTQKQAPCPSCQTSMQKLENFCSKCGRSLSHLKTNVSKEFWAKLFILILGCSIATLSINAPTFAIAQGPMGITYQEDWANSASAFPNITGYQPLEFLYRDPNYEKIAHQDAALMYAYFPDNLSKPLIYVAVNIANSISNLHSWEVCLVTYQTAQGQSPLVTTLNSRDIELVQDVPIIGRYFTFRSPQNYTQVTLYWYEKAALNVGVTVEQRFVRISLIILTQNSADQKQFEDELLPIGQAMANYWEPLRNTSLISLGIPTLQALLAASIAMVAFTKTTQYFTEFRKKTTNQRLFKNFASQDEKRMLETLHKVATTKKTMNTKDIKEALELNTGEPVDEENLQKTMTRLEEYGFVKRDVVSVNNNPLLIWKT